MGTRGPKKEPAEVKARKRTAQPHRDPAPVAQSYGIPPNPFPAKTAAAERKTYDELVAGMKATGMHIVLTPGDFGALEACAVALTRARQATAQVRAMKVEDRMVTSHANGMLAHPWLREEKAAWKEARAFMADLGMSPTARNNVTAAKAAGATGQSDDPVMAAILSIVPQAAKS